MQQRTASFFSKHPEILPLRVYELGNRRVVKVNQVVRIGGSDYFLSQDGKVYSHALRGGRCYVINDTGNVRSALEAFVSFGLLKSKTFDTLMANVGQRNKLESRRQRAKACRSSLNALGIKIPAALERLAK